MEEQFLNYPQERLFYRLPDNCIKFDDEPLSAYTTVNFGHITIMPRTPNTSDPGKLCIKSKAKNSKLKWTVCWG